MKQAAFATIDDYISAAAPAAQPILTRIRTTVRRLAPSGTEAISYGMPTCKLNGKNLVHFAAFKHHIGFYPTPSGTEQFQHRLAPYKHAKGSIQFQLDEPIPYDLVEDIVAFRIKESEQAAAEA